MRLTALSAARILIPAVLACACATNAGAQTATVNAFGKVEATRAQAFGGAATALGLDPTLVWVNPAAAALVADPSITLAGQRGYFGEVTGQGVWTTALGGGRIVLGALYYDAGQVSLKASDGTWRTMNLQQDFAASVSYAAALSKDVASGFTIKGLRSQLFGDFTAHAIAADGGVQMRLTDMLKGGFAVQNVGTRLKYSKEKISLPAALRGGLAMGLRMRSLGSPAEGDSDTVVVVCDAVLPAEENGVSLKGGAEYSWRGIISLRAGVSFSTWKELSNYSAGFGLNLRRFRIDYGIRFGSVFDNPQTLSLTIALSRRDAAPSSAPSQ
jgi:hypothetical protein